MKAAWIVAVAALALSGCAVRSARAVPPAVERTMRMHVRNAVQVGEGDALVRQLRRRIIAEPGNVQLRLDLAERYAASGIQELATEHYRLAAERFPDHAPAHRMLAQALRQEHLTAAAAQVMDSYLARNPQATAEMWSWAGIIHDENGSYAAGERAHRNALLRRQPTAWLLNNLGHNLLLQGRAGEAAREFRSALALEPRNQLARNNLGIALSRNANEAVVHLQSVTDPSTAHNNLAVVLMEQGRLPEARQELHRALAYRRDNTAALKNLAILGEMDGLGAELKPPAGKRRGGAWAATVRKMLGGEP